MTTNITDSRIIKHSSDDDVVLSVQGVSKKFCRSLKRSLFYGVQDIASELVGVRKDNNQLRQKEFWALQDVSFELKRGESLGLVGANGSGKTTLLRIISGLIKPDRGSVKITGKVAPLIALGAGFNPILTGRENIYVNMSILGLSKEEIDERFDEVVDFAEIGDAIDAPVQTYSSGMAARLGFACAIHTDPDILLIDEVLAVGDIKFRVKCYRRLVKLLENNTSFILVSHNPHSILGICNYSVYLNKGILITWDNTNLVMSEYQKQISQKYIRQNVKTCVNNVTKHDQELAIISINLEDSHGKSMNTLISGNYCIFTIYIKAAKKIDNAIINIIIKENCTNSMSTLYLSNYYDNEELKILPSSEKVQLKMPYCGLKPGQYSMKLSISKDSPQNILDAVEVFIFEVKSFVNMFDCQFYQPKIWKIA